MNGNQQFLNSNR